MYEEWAMPLLKQETLVTSTRLWNLPTPSTNSRHLTRQISWFNPGRYMDYREREGERGGNISGSAENSPNVGGWKWHTRKAARETEVGGRGDTKRTSRISCVWYIEKTQMKEIEVPGTKVGGGERRRQQQDLTQIKQKAPDLDRNVRWPTKTVTTTASIKKWKRRERPWWRWLFRLTNRGTPSIGRDLGRVNPRHAGHSATIGARAWGSTVPHERERAHSPSPAQSRQLPFGYFY